MLVCKLRLVWQFEGRTFTVMLAMPDIVLTTLNAKYIHASFGLRYLMANLGDLQGRCVRWISSKRSWRGRRA